MSAAGLTGPPGAELWPRLEFKGDPAERNADVDTAPTPRQRGAAADDDDEEGVVQRRELASRPRGVASQDKLRGRNGRKLLKVSPKSSVSHFSPDLTRFLLNLIILIRFTCKVRPQPNTKLRPCHGLCKTRQPFVSGAGVTGGHRLLLLSLLR